MPDFVNISQSLRTQYDALPWHKKAGFWLSAPRLASGLFGDKPADLGRIRSLLQLASESRVYATEFERAIQDQCASNYPKDNSDLPMPERILTLVGAYSGGEPGYANASRRHFKFSPSTTRVQEITKNLLLAVAYGMESKEANIPVKASDAGDLFKSHLYAKELLQKAPEYLLARGDVTDLAGRTVENITAFEYAAWANDFDMIDMMLDCIPATPDGDNIRVELLKQANQVKAPLESGGGLTYTHTYDRPNLDASGIPDGTTTTVTNERTENHFNLAPLCEAYQNYEDHYHERTNAQRDAYWIKWIGHLQRLLPMHVLQRYLDPNNPFYPIPELIDVKFKRATNFYNQVTRTHASLFSASLSADVALARGTGAATGGVRFDSLDRFIDLSVICLLADASANKINTVIEQLSQPKAVQCCPVRPK